MAFSASSNRIRLEGGQLLIAECLRHDGSRKRGRLDLNQHIGNREGNFDPEGSNFVATARDVQLEGTVLRAELRSSMGAWWPDAIDLDSFVENQDGNLTIVKHVVQNTTRLRPQPATFNQSSAHDIQNGLQSAPQCQLCRNWSVPGSREDRLEKVILIRLSDLSSRKRRTDCASCGLAERIILELAPRLFRGRGILPENYTIQFSRRLLNDTRPTFEIQASTSSGEKESIRCLMHTVTGNENTSQTFGNISNGFLLRGESKSRDSVLMARAWLDNCVSRHRKCPKSVNRRLPTRILDIGFKSDDPVKLMTTSNMGPATYACLSHCWGKSNPLLLTQANLDSLHKGIPYRSLQETYIDAIELTRKLGIRYIWIDTLCIIQNSPGDWKTESSKMHEYYGNCFLCIAATSAADHDGGCRTRDLTIQHVGRGDDGWPYSVYARALIPHINHSGMYPHERYFPLLTRAWVYQERRLSSRVLHVTDAEFFFECSSTTHCECGGSDGGNNTTSAWTKAEETFFAAHRRVNQMPDGPLKGEHEWRAHIHAYSTLDLTKQSDRLPALSGLAQWTRLRRQQLGKDPGRYLAGCWESTLIDDLSWVVGHQLTRYEVDKDGGWRGIPGLFTAAGSDSNPSRTKPTEYVAPSWSWSSVLDRVNYAPFGHSEALCHIEDAHVEPATEGGDPYGQLKDGWLILRAKLRPSRWVTQKKFFNGFSTYLTDIAGTQQTLMGLKKDNGLQWWRDWRDGDGSRLDGDQRLYVMPLASRKIWSNSEGAEFHLQWMPGILTVTETAYLVLRLVEGESGTEDPGVYERVGWASYSGVTGGPDFRGIEMGYLKLI